MRRPFYITCLYFYIKSSLRITSAIFLLVFFSIVILVISANAQWSYKRPISITNNTGVRLTDYQVLVTLTTTEMGNPYTNVNADGSDIRFSTGDQFTPEPYWIESWDNTDTSKIWVKVPTISPGTTTPISMYYGNTSASSESDSSVTFTLV